MNKNMSRTVCVFILVAGLFVTLATQDFDIKVIEKPVPKYHGLSNAQNLILSRSVDEISENSLRYFQGIQAAAVDKSGNFYFFDYKHCCIVKLDPGLKYVARISRKGEGPGEIRQETQAPTVVFLSAGLDGHLYLFDIMRKLIMKFSLDGKFQGDFKIEQFVPVKVLADENGSLYLPSVHDHILDVYNPKMVYLKSLVAKSRYWNNFLFAKPPACVIHRYIMPSFGIVYYDFLSTGDLLLINNVDLSVMVFDRLNGTLKKQFYAWDDFVLAEYRGKIANAIKIAEETPGTCAYSTAFSNFFLDECDNIFLQFVDTHKDSYIYRLSVDGNVLQVFKVIKPDIEGDPRFFYVKNNCFYGYTQFGVHIFEPAYAPRKGELHSPLSRGGHFYE